VILHAVDLLKVEDLCLIEVSNSSAPVWWTKKTLHVSSRKKYQ